MDKDVDEVVVVVDAAVDMEVANANPTFATSIAGPMVSPTPTAVVTATIKMKAMWTQLPLKIDAVVATVVKACGVKLPSEGVGSWNLLVIFVNV